MIVPVQTVRSVIGHVEIGPAVVIEVARCNSEAPASVRDAGAIGDVREREVVIVAEERGARRRLATLQRGARRSVHQIDVEPAVIIEVDEGDAARRDVENGGFLW